jgi:Xaa-Pro dipeptidase
LTAAVEVVTLRRVLRRALLRHGGAAMAVASVSGLGCRRSAGPSPAVPAEPEATAAGVDDDPFAALAGFCDGIAPPDAAERAEQRERLQRALHDAGHDALIAEPGPTMQYLAGVRWGRSERPFLLVLPRAGEPWWVVPAFEERTAREQLGDDAVVRVWQEHESPHAIAAAGLAAQGLSAGTVAVDPQLRHFVAEGLRQALGAGRVVDGAAAVDGVRMRKRPAELARLRRANLATKAALRVVARTAVHEGMRQSELAAQVRLAQERAGLSDVWVLALFGPNAAFPHGTEHDRPLAEGDLVLVDTGGSLHGHRSDITRTWALGTPPAAAARAWSVVAAAQRAALEKVRPGVACGEVDAAARAVVDAAGFGPGYRRFTHRLGHGIGLEVHEHPYLVPGSTRILEPGMTMSIEPGIYEPGAFGVRIEDIVAVTDDLCEPFGPLVESLEAPFGPAA